MMARVVEGMNMFRDGHLFFPEQRHCGYESDPMAAKRGGIAHDTNAYSYLRNEKYWRIRWMIYSESTAPQCIPEKPNGWLVAKANGSDLRPREEAEFNIKSMR